MKGPVQLIVGVKKKREVDFTSEVKAWSSEDIKHLRTIARYGLGFMIVGLTYSGYSVADSINQEPAPIEIENPGNIVVSGAEIARLFSIQLDLGRTVLYGWTALETASIGLTASRALKEREDS